MCGRWVEFGMTRGVTIVYGERVPLMWEVGSGDEEERSNAGVRRKSTTDVGGGER